MIILYGIRNCDTIKKTLQWLESNGHEYQFHDYRKEGIEASLIHQFLKQFTLEELINKRGTTWRKLPESDKQGLTLENAGKLMETNPSLIRRPILVDGDRWLIGFDPQMFNEILIP